MSTIWCFELGDKNTFCLIDVALPAGMSKHQTTINIGGGGERPKLSRFVWAHP